MGLLASEITYAAFRTPRLARPDMSGPAGQRGHFQNLQGRRCPECNQLKRKQSLFYHNSVLILPIA